MSDAAAGWPERNHQGEQQPVPAAPATAGAQGPGHVYPQRLAGPPVGRAGQRDAAGLPAPVAGLAPAAGNPRAAGHGPCGTGPCRRGGVVPAGRIAWLAGVRLLAGAEQPGTARPRSGGRLRSGASGIAGQPVARARSAGAVQGSGFGSRAAVPAVPAGVDLAGVPQVPPVEVGEQRVEEHELGVGRLPDQEVRGPLLAGRPDEQVHVGDAGLVEVAREHLLVDLVGPSLPAATSAAIAAAASAISARPP